jgi:hypothetical protein
MKFEKPSIQTCFFIVTIAILWFINLKSIDPSTPLKIISSIFLTFPIALLAIFAIPKIKVAIKDYYKKQRDKINIKIKDIRSEQERIEDVSKLIDLDEEILYLREELKGVQSNRFEKSSLFSIVWFTFTIFVFYLNLGTYISTPTNLLGTITFSTGLYYLSIMFRSIFIAFEN